METNTLLWLLPPSQTTDDNSDDPPPQLSASSSIEPLIEIAATETSPRRVVAFLTPNDFTNPLKEAYSGMWWQTREGFLQSEWVHYQQLEVASFKAFRGDRVRKTRDWLDFAVTHLSVFWKHFRRMATTDHRTEMVFRTIANYLDQYTEQVQALPILVDSPVQETIAVLPFLVREQGNKTIDVLPNHALRATLASLWQIGIARCVVVVGGGLSPVMERESVENTFQSLAPKFKQRSMELSVITWSNATTLDRANMPRVTLRGLQLAMRGQLSRNEIEQWLGEDNDKRWSFVFFTEPDLILHARPEALPSLKDEMRRGSVLSGHRFQPIPHQDNFPTFDRMEAVLPSIFAPLPDRLMVVDILDANQSCCDGGRYYPSNPRHTGQPLKNNRACPGRVRNYWWACGFYRPFQNYSDPVVVAELHAFLRQYQFLQIRHGTPFPLVDLHQRICHFRRGQNCADDYTAASIIPSS